MIKLLAEEYLNLYSFLNLFNFITFRTGAAILTSLFFSLIFGEMIINSLSKFQPIGQPIRIDGPENHIIQKSGTPTMGGILIILSIITSLFLWSDLSNKYVWIGIFTLISFGTIGIIDDYKKIKFNSSQGLRGRTRIFFQIIICFIIIFFIINNLNEKIGTTIAFPFFKNFVIDFGIFYFFIGIFIILGSANSVNLTDGLDGLAIVPVMIVAMSFAFIAYLSGNIFFAEYLLISYIPGSGELSVFCGALIGSALGFLWFNAPPAKVFMGDTGSLALGSSLGSIAIMVKHEIVLAIIGGLFVLETLSVIIQVISFKFTGKRVFMMAPLHHHFEKKGWAESTIVIRFWIITIVLALIGLATLKIR
ncbi:MAG: Phospho-N-acetylmuramoyl-pentapeptide-transferase [Alphaproteobacteria bacterium MarineAlpha5_Bin5]|nr:MAG: Phospho-N-acetylmuramoyl-pentapeptide-transferase [Alphaproteobacteria bacterium MarineAlpha5_Bin5]